MDPYSILIIFLSVALAFSLAVWIIVGVLIIQVLRKLKETTEKAQHVAENVEAFTSHLKNAGKASAIGSIVRQFAKAFNKKSK